MSHDVSLQDLLDSARLSRNRDIAATARKIESDLSQGVTPGIKAIRQLMAMLQDRPACIRLGDDGRCGGWLRKHGAALGIAGALPPWTCPFAATGTKSARFDDCAGYRST